MTIPTLMTKYHRSVAENKLKKFYTTINQALRMNIADDVGVPAIYNPDETPTLNSSEAVQNWYQEYILNRMSGASINRFDSSYVKVILKDGSGFISYSNNGRDAYIFYCLNSLDASCVPESYDGKNTFLFKYYSDKTEVRPDWHDANLENSKTSCYATDIHRHACVRLIMLNGWKIPNDYPWIK